ncbi:acyltransferase family protein [Derxia gummosa]|uniref:Acyltransferase family protein n=1 Tax=Derxia gummosa DSM 723 TaxID=1121388 RepID=A0A8B6X9G4_9BURK|nr:acyltransferase family protein [Derxia gummosa]
MSQVHAHAYRPEVDGLRSLAILPVLLFHAGFPGFYGGFVGVDVFFVISGFLITGIIAREVVDGRFSIAEFYRRRILRIFPALFVMVAVSAIVATLSGLPLELVSFARSVVSTWSFASNILFYTESGYFGPEAHGMPLLHTWSLAVEEQFYLVWPLLLWGFGKKRGGAVGMTLGIGIASFIAALVMLPRDASAAFYLIPSRAWELLAGALVALLPMPVLRNRALREVVSIAGLLAILWTVKFYSQATPFPGLGALPPVLGAAAIIAATGYGPCMVGRLLSLRPLVFIGLISFSLYLWHWPVIVYSQSALFLEQTLAVKCGLVAVSMLLAWLSWRFVEQPFRVNAKRFTTPRVLRAGGLVTAGFVLTGVLGIVSHGLPARFTPEELTIAGYEGYEGDRAYRGGECFVVQPDDPFDAAKCLARSGDRPALLIVGDSHGAHLWPGMHAEAHGMDVLQATATGCRPTINPEAKGEAPCRGFFRNVLGEWLPTHRVSTLVVAGRWTRADLPALRQTLAAVEDSADRVVLVGPIPQYATALPRIIVHAMQAEDPTAVRRGLVSEIFRLDAEMKRQFAGGKLHYVSLVDMLCKDGDCRAYAREGVPMQFDYGHLTVEGSEIVARSILGQIGDLQADGPLPAVTALVH